MSHRHLPPKVAEVRDATIWATLVRVISWEADIDAAQEVIVHPKRPVQGEKADSPLRRPRIDVPPRHYAVNGWLLVVSVEHAVAGAVIARR